MLFACAVSSFYAVLCVICVVSPVDKRLFIHSYLNIAARAVKNWSKKEGSGLKETKTSDDGDEYHAERIDKLHQLQPRWQLYLDWDESRVQDLQLRALWEVLYTV